MTLRLCGLLLALCVALAGCGGDSGAEAASVTTTTTTTTTEPTDRPSDTTTSSTTGPGLPVDEEGRTIPALSGTPLPGRPASGADPAIGMTIPTAEGLSVDGSLVSIGPRSEPQAIVFLAHWCPHCRSEVADYSDWLATSTMPDGTSLIAVTTSIDPLRQNYPPEDWLLGAGWPVPTLVDPTNEVAQAYGVTAFPFWVLVDGTGAVVIRGAGSIAPESIAEALTTIAGGGTTG